MQCADEKYKPFEILQYTVVLILLLFFTRVKKEIKLDAQSVQIIHKLAINDYSQVNVNRKLLYSNAKSIQFAPSQAANLVD